MWCTNTGAGAIILLVAPYLRSFLVILLICIGASVSRSEPEKDKDEDKGRKIKIEAISDLDFGVSPQGDGPKTVPPGTSENASNASFLVTGKRGHSYSIILPTGTVTLKTQGGGSGSAIEVINFRSYPPVGPNGVLDSSGRQYIYVGATRLALSRVQKVGEYSGHFLVEVVY